MTQLAFRFLDQAFGSGKGKKKIKGGLSFQANIQLKVSIRQLDILVWALRDTYELKGYPIIELPLIPYNIQLKAKSCFLYYPLILQKPNTYKLFLTSSYRDISPQFPVSCNKLNQANFINLQACFWWPLEGTYKVIVSCCFHKDYHDQNLVYLSKLISGHCYIEMLLLFFYIESGTFGIGPGK